MHLINLKLIYSCLLVYYEVEVPVYVDRYIDREFEVEKPVYYEVEIAVDRPVYIDRLVEKEVEVEKPVYYEVDRPG